MTYQIGSHIRLSASFKNSDATDADPTTVVLKLKLPSGTETSVTPTRDGTGAYHYDMVPTVSGSYFFRWVGTGAVVAASEGFIKVAGSEFRSP